jgi:hypothetical protein
MPGEVVRRSRQERVSAAPNHVLVEMARRMGFSCGKIAPEVRATGSQPCATPGDRRADRARVVRIPGRHAAADPLSGSGAVCPVDRPGSA